MSIKLISLNIECSVHYERIFPFLEQENPDVICLQEVLEDDFYFIQEKLGLEGVYQAHDYFTSEYERHKHFRHKKYGVAIFAKKISKSNPFFFWGKQENLLLPVTEFILDTKESQNYALLHADILGRDGATYRVVTTHFPATHKGESSPHQLEILDPFFKHLNTLGEFVLCGDFNAPRGNETFRRIASVYKDSIPEHYKTSIDQNLHRDKGIMFMVDGLFVTPSLKATDVSLCDGVSDHMAIIATIDTK